VSAQKRFNAVLSEDCCGEKVVVLRFKGDNYPASYDFNNEMEVPLDELHLILNALKKPFSVQCDWSESYQLCTVDRRQYGVSVNDEKPKGKRVAANEWVVIKCGRTEGLWIASDKNLKELIELMEFVKANIS
jgi:hypothetical protein